MLWNLFYHFVIIGLVSFGGGYGMIPMIERAVVEQNGWMSAAAFSDTISVAGMSPGPIATNIAVSVGYHTAGWLGAIISTIGIVLPSFLLVFMASIFLYKYYTSTWVQSAFYGLRPVITGMILYGAYRFAINSGLVTSINWNTIIVVALFIFALFALMRLRMHPLYVIVLSGLIGIAIYT